MQLSSLPSYHAQVLLAAVRDMRVAKTKTLHVAAERDARKLAAQLIGAGC